MPSRTAVVTATYSRRMSLRLDGGDTVTARIRGKRLRPVCGDRVDAEPIDGESEWLITRIRERDNALARPNLRGDTEVLAANIDRLAAMAAAEPAPDWALLDRYIAAAENIGAAAVVLYNKADLGGPDHAGAELEVYARLGYTTIRCSARHGENLDRVAEALSSGVSIVVGQSGVGKSTLINRLSGDDLQRTAALSPRRGQGRHTTVNSVMLFLPQGGAVIDSPGVRDFAPAFDSPGDVVRGFTEIAEAGTACRFNDCRHFVEPGCAVRKAVGCGEISRRRYDSYRFLRERSATLSGLR